MKNLIVLIPAHDEGEHIATVVKAARQYLPVLVVDDGSTDGTARLAKAAGAVVLRQSPNQGKGAALLAGFRHALGLGYKAVITLDGDGQHDPAEIPKFLAAYRDHPAGLLIGRRDFSRMPFIRRLANSLGGALLSMAVGQKIPDNQSGYRLVNESLIKIMLENKERGFEFEVDMVVLALKHSLGIGWVPIKTIYAGEKSHIKPIDHLFNFLRVTVKAWQSVHEIKERRSLL
ncbi:MAG: glycosyltransferase family 2 protein [Anaerolineaceae bacterium]